MEVKTNVKAGLFNDVSIEVLGIGVGNTDGYPCGTIPLDIWVAIL